VTNEVTTTDDNWATVPEGTGSLLRGSMAKFKDEHFWLDTTTDITGSTWIVTDVVTAWLKWSDNQPAEHRITQPGRRHPDSDELPDTDQDQWKPGLDGKPADPWKDTRYLYLVDGKTAAEITFVTDTVGGRRAVGDLKRQVANMRTAHPRALPVVRLDEGTMLSRFGPKPKPTFTVVDWKRKEAPPRQVAAALAHADNSKRSPRRDDMDDAIPF
jgi:hypothetical protein